MNITVRITPALEQIAGALRGAELDKKLHDIITEFAFTIERYAKQVTPVDTGRLRASIGTGFLLSAGMERGGTAIIAPHVDYAGWVHEGTRSMRARPFLQWGVDFASQKFSGQQIADRLDDELRKTLSRL